MSLILFEKSIRRVRWGLRGRKLQLLILRFTLRGLILLRLELQRSCRSSSRIAS
jgi:hypothetical protein